MNTEYAVEDCTKKTRSMNEVLSKYLVKSFCREIHIWHEQVQPFRSFSVANRVAESVAPVCRSYSSKKEPFGSPVFSHEKFSYYFVFRLPTDRNRLLRYNSSLLFCQCAKNLTMFESLERISIDSDMSQTTIIICSC